MRSTSPNTPDTTTHAPARMRAVVAREYGDERVLHLDTVPTPQPASDQVLIAVRAAALDRGTWHLMAGQPALVRLMGFGLRAPKQPVPGLDVAGVVVAVGAAVTRFAPGDEVFGTAASGSFAEYAVAKEDRLSPKPDALSFTQAAAIPVSAQTALQGLTDHGHLQAGQRVLVMGASGGVGSYAVQIAKALGAHVTGVCSTAKVDLVRSLGADDVLDYTQHDPLDGTGRYDLILDIGGRSPVRRLRRALTPRGTLVIVGGEGGGRWLGGFQRQIGAMLRSPFTRHRLRTFVASDHHRGLDRLVELVDAGSLTPAVERTYPLDQAADAMAQLARGQVRGKVVLVP